MPKTKVKPKKKPVHENCLFVADLPVIRKKVEELMEERKINPSVVQEGDAGVVFMKGEPHMVIDDEYIPHSKAQVIIQTRKVVREYIKLQKIINKEEL